MSTRLLANPEPGPLPGFSERATRWLESVARPRATGGGPPQWGEGSDDVSVFHRLSFDEERRLLDQAMAWQQLKFDAGYGALAWPAELGGAGLGAQAESTFADLENGFATPPGHELLSVTVALVAPTVRTFGTLEQQAAFVRTFLRAEQLCCQLFSEPDAGSDLAGVRTTAARDARGDWVINGQKVWTSGAQFAEWGLLVARTDATGRRHESLTGFLVPMGAPGVEVRPIRQMSGGTSFNEVYLTNVPIADSLRLGQVGEGWKVAVTTLGFERAGGAGGRNVGGTWEQVLAATRHLGAGRDPVMRQRLAGLYVLGRVREMLAARVEQQAMAGYTPGPECSIGKLLWTRHLTQISEVISAVLGPRLTADTGEWGTFAWTDHVLGAPGYRIAGGSDEIQRNIIAERVLGLPRDPAREVTR